MKLLSFLTLLLFTATNNTPSHHRWIPVVSTTSACDTLDTFKESDSSGYYVLQCDSIRIRCIYEANGHYDLAYKRPNDKTYWEMCFKNYNKLSSIDSFDFEGNLVYHKNYLDGIFDTVVYGGKYR
jgi:hypothetical protein